MINFKNLIVIKTLSLEQGDIHFLDLSTTSIKKLTEAENKKKKPDIEKLTLILMGAMICDEKGNLLNFTKKDAEDIPKSILAEMVSFTHSVAMGEKKS